MKIQAMRQGRRFSFCCRRAISVAAWGILLASVASAQTISVPPYQPQASSQYDATNSIPNESKDAYAYEVGQFVQGSDAYQTQFGASNIIADNQPGFIEYPGYGNYYDQGVVDYNDFGSNAIIDGENAYDWAEGSASFPSRLADEDVRQEKDSSYERPRLSALDIWTAFLFGNRKKEKPSTSKSSGDLFRKPQAPRWASTRRPDKLAPNPIFSLFGFGRNQSQSNDQDYVDSDLNPNTLAWSQDYYGDQSFDSSYNVETPFAVPPQAAFDGFNDLQNEGYEDGDISATFGQNAAFSHNASRHLKGGNAALSHYPQNREIGYQTAYRLDDHNAVKHSSSTRNRVAQNLNAAQHRIERVVEQNGTRLANATNVDGARLAQSHARTREANNQSLAQKSTNAASRAFNNESKPQTQPLDSRKRRLQELNAILAEKRPEEYAMRIRQASARIAREESQRNLQKVEGGSLERDAARMNRSKIRQASNVAPKQKSTATNASSASAQTSANAKTRARDSFDNNQTAPRRAIAPTRIPTYDSRQNQNVAVAPQTVEPLKNAATQPSEQNSTRRSTAKFIDPKTL